MQAARAATAKLVDITAAGFGPRSEWSGGPATPDFPPASSCAGFRPDLSSVVINGASKAVFKHSWHRVFNQTNVLKTRAQAELLWRTADSADELACVRKTLATPGDPSTRFVSLRRLTPPTIGTHTTAYRAVFAFGGKSNPQHAIIDTLEVTKGRTAIAFITEADLASAAKTWQAELQLARKLAARVAS